MKTVLFVCVGNSARSIMAEALFNAKAPEGWGASSGGTKPASRISEDAIAALDEIAVKVEKKKPSSLDKELAKSAEIGITMGCEVEDECPVLFTPVKEDWGIDDPRGQPKEKYQEIRDEIKRKVEELVEEIMNGGDKMKILIATDGSEGSEKAIRFASKLASESKSSVTLLHVIPKIETTKEEIIILLKEEIGSPEKAGKKYLEEGSKVAEEFGIKHETKFLEGKEVDEILRESEN
jgi:arsenate reductase